MLLLALLIVLEQAALLLDCLTQHVFNAHAPDQVFAYWQQRGLRKAVQLCTREGRCSRRRRPTADPYIAGRGAMIRITVRAKLSKLYIIMIMNSRVHSALCRPPGYGSGLTKLKHANGLWGTSAPAEFVLVVRDRDASGNAWLLIAMYRGRISAHSNEIC